MPKINEKFDFWAKKYFFDPLLTIDYKQYFSGKGSPKKRKKYMDADARILQKVLHYNETDLIYYLRGLAYNFVMDQEFSSYFVNKFLYGKYAK